MQEIACPLCNKTNEEVAIKENGYLGRRCRDCGVIYISPRPSFDELLNLYGHGESHTGSRTFVTAADRLNARQNIKVLNDFLRSGSLLEIGAKTGAFVAEARKSGFDVYAVELNKSEAAYINDTHGIPCETDPLSEATFGGKLFDIIYHCDVTSHFYEPLEEFRRLHDRLKPGGIMVFETGNIGELDAEQLKNFDLFQYPDHLFFFGEDSIRKLLAQSGFETLEIRGYSIVPQLALMSIVLRLRGLLRRLRGKSAGPKVAAAAAAPVTATPTPPPSSSAAKRVLRSAWDYLLHFCKFGIGAVFKRNGTPQTYICVARRA
jgi:SAM-dependent methyltransferase